MDITDIAIVCHNVNRAYCQSQGDHSQMPWENAPPWQRDSAINGVKYHLDNPDAGPEGSHNSWLKEKEENGWRYGKEKDVQKKEHPCCVPYKELPTFQQAKDYIFSAIVHELKNL